MDGWAIAIWIVGGLIAVGALVRLMLARRGQVVQQWQVKAAAEKRKKKAE